MASVLEKTPTSVSEKLSEDPTTNMEEEIAELTAQFKGQCKVITTTGRFVRTVKLHPEDLDIVFNFKLTESYPTTVPVIEIRSQSLDEDDMFDLHGFMSQTADTMSLVSLDELVKVALKWLAEGHISVKGNRNKQRKQEQGEGRGRKGKKSKKKKDKEHTEKGKKPPMKTAIDVVKRILWDADLEQDHFLIGYLDRIEGLKEKYFNAFSWEDIASVDYTVLAIPKHRIQYFKYKGEIVWDKRYRLDNMFGSTGSKITIKDIIAKIDGKNTNRDQDADDNDDTEHADKHHDSDYYDSGDCTDSDSDSDDGVTITIGNTEGGACGGGAEFDSEDENAVNDDDDDDNFNKYWRDKLRPNYFIALRITDEDIRHEIGHVQDYITENEPKFNVCCIPKAALHITLCTVRLETPEQVQNAVKCLEDAQDELKSFVPKDKALKFMGVDNFFNRVVYGRVVDCPPEFYELVEHLKLCLNEQGIEIRDYHEFVPHMTVMKISRPVARATGKKYIAPWLYSCFNDFEFGSQSVDNLHLCEMGDDRQGDGFYVTALSLKL